MGAGLAESELDVTSGVPPGLLAEMTRYQSIMNEVGQGALQAHKAMAAKHLQGVATDSPELWEMHHAEVKRANCLLHSLLEQQFARAHFAFVESSQLDWEGLRDQEDVCFVDAIDSSSPKNLVSGEFTVNFARL